MPIHSGYIAILVIFAILCPEPSRNLQNPNYSALKLPGTLPEHVVLSVQISMNTQTPASLTLVVDSACTDAQCQIRGNPEQKTTHSL